VAVVAARKLDLMVVEVVTEVSAAAPAAPERGRAMLATREEQAASAAAAAAKAVMEVLAAVAVEVIAGERLILGVAAVAVVGSGARFSMKAAQLY
jgi:hypothetical protein